MIEKIKLFMTYFSGLNRAYGLYQLKNPEKKGDKILGKPSTIVGNVDLPLWEKHFKGENGLGIVPIKDGNVCSFGAIDIDVYTGLDIPAILKKIKSVDMPLVPCRSKSGGLHCFCFVSEDIPATMMKNKLGMMAAYLGFGNTEIFPKQDNLLTDRGDVGQWINMPYFEGEKTERYGLKVNGDRLNVDDFLTEVTKKRLTKKEFEAYTLITLKELTDGPPCLQNLLATGFKEGHRNDAAFNLAIYLKKAYPDNWETVLDSYNMKYIFPPLPTVDINAITKSVKRKDYLYSCGKPPIKSYCNISLCRSRQYGIGSANGSITLSNLAKYNSQPPIWFVNVDDIGRLEVNTEDIQSQSKFQKRCMESLNIMPIPMAPTLWQSVIQTLMDNVTLIEAAIEASPKGLLFEYLERFCTSRVQARTIDEVLLGKPWSDETHHWFRLSDFYSFLERLRFREFKIHQIGSMLKEAGGNHSFIKLKGKGMNIWKINLFEKQTEGFDAPEIDDKEVM